MENLVNSGDFPIFLRNNLQLEELDVLFYGKTQCIDDICNYSENVKSLTIALLISIDVKYLKRIVHLKKLTRLKIHPVNFQNAVDYE